MLKQARYFQTVVRCGSFSKAAEECFISQSAISQQVQALEKELGVELLHREGRRFSLTPAGELFYQKSLARPNVHSLPVIPKIFRRRVNPKFCVKSI